MTSACRIGQSLWTSAASHLIYAAWIGCLVSNVLAADAHAACPVSHAHDKSSRNLAVGACNTVHIVTVRVLGSVSCIACRCHISDAHDIGLRHVGNQHGDQQPDL